MTETYTNILFLMKTKNGHILTFSKKMQISAILCFATCDWFCPMTSHILPFNNEKTHKNTQNTQGVNYSIYQFDRSHLP